MYIYIYICTYVYICIYICNTMIYPVILNTIIYPVISLYKPIIYHCPLFLDVHDYPIVEPQRGLKIPHISPHPAPLG